MALRGMGGIAAVLATLILEATARVGGAQAVAGGANPRVVTFNRDVAPVLFNRCAVCHRPNGPAPFSLLTYRDATQRAALIAAVTKSRYMPPWKPEPEHGEFADSRRLSDHELQLLDRWVRDGALEGDPADLPPVPHWAAGWQLGQPDLIVTLPEYVSAPDGPDVFRNFVVPVRIGADRFVRGVEFRSGNRAVHHAAIFVDETRNSRGLDEADPAPGYEGIIPLSADYPEGNFLGWTPGVVPSLAPKGLSWRLAQGSDFVVQLHILRTGKPERIQASIGLFFTPDAPERTPTILRVGSHAISIPPGAADYHIHDEYILPVDVEVQSIYPHAHYRARQVTAWAELPDGSRRWLIAIRDWDFNWQDVYRYAAPFSLPAGTKLETDWTFDNSASNPRNPEIPPRHVLWGPRSWDEMGDVMVQVVTRLASDRLRLTNDFRYKALTQDIEGLELQLTLNPDRAAVRNEVALAYLELGRPEQAVAHFEVVSRLQPESALARYNVGVALEAAGRPDEAAARYRETLQLDSTYAAAHNNLGNIFLAQERMGEAREHYQRAVELAPDDAGVHNNLGGVLIELGDTTGAIDELQQALRLQADFAEADYNLGRAFVRQRRVREAIDRFHAALRQRPDWIECLKSLAWVLSVDPTPSLRNPAEAVDLARRAVAIGGPRDGSALDVLAAAYASAGRFDDAVRTATVALDLANASDLDAIAEQVRQRLDLYSRRMSYIEP